MAEAPHNILCDCTACEVARERRYYEKLLADKMGEIQRLTNRVERLKKRLKKGTTS